MLAGTEAIMLDGTLSGRAVHETTTADGSDGIEAMADDGTPVNHSIGTMTGETMVDGMVIVAGTVPNDEAGTETTTLAGIEAIKVDGTESGISDQATTTTDGDEAIVMITLDGSEATAV